MSSDCLRFGEFQKLRRLLECAAEKMAVADEVGAVGVELLHFLENRLQINDHLIVAFKGGRSVLAQILSLDLAAAFLGFFMANQIDQITVDFLGHIAEELAPITGLPSGGVTANQPAKCIVDKARGRGVQAGADADDILALPSDSLQIVLDKPVEFVGRLRISGVRRVEQASDCSGISHD